MTDIRTTLVRIERRVTMPEPAMERLLRRREGRERRERIAAGAVGLAVAAAGLAGALVTLRVAEGTGAASGGRGVADGGGGFVLPTVAIWTAVVVLGLTVLVAVRLRRRLAHVEDVDLGGRGPGRTAASARRPAADLGPTWKGGTHMDSRQKPITGIPQAEIPEIRLGDRRLRRTNQWLVAAVVVLVAGVVGLGAALMAQLGEEPTPPPSDVATTEVARTLDAMNEALGAGDAATMATFYAEDAVVTDVIAGNETEGAPAIAAHYTSVMGDANVERTSDVIRVGDFAAHTITYTGYGGGEGILVFELDEDLKIIHQWIIGI